MLTMNRATLLGHAGRNPEMRKLPSGDDVALFSLATTERFRRRDGTDGEDTEWHAVVAYGAAAEAARKLLRKGDRVLVEGRIATRYWRDRTGIERRTTEIVVSGPQARVNVLTKRRQEPDGDDEPSGGAAPAAAAGQVAPEPGGAAAVASGATGSADGDGDRSDSAGRTTDGGTEGGKNGEVSAVAVDATEETVEENGDAPGAVNQAALPLVPAEDAAGEGNGEPGPEHGPAGLSGAADGEAGPGAGPAGEVRRETGGEGDSVESGIVRPSGGGGDGHE